MFHIPIFKVVYSTTFTIFLVILLALLLVTPADAIFQSYVNNQLFNVIIIGAAYLLTALISGFIYATRIYATRTHLAALPRSARVPNDVAGTALRRIVAAGQARAAAIAYAAHPRDLVVECDEDGNPPSVPAVLYKPAEVGSRNLPRPTPAFGHIAHPGWTPPSTADLPGVQFTPVIQELPHLLEAKAVSLAPPDPLVPIGLLSSEDANEGPAPDPFAVAMLQRPASMDVRLYIAHLNSLGVIADSKIAAEFVSRYERARFGGTSLTEAQFRALMNCFATLLRCLTSPDPERLHDLARSSSTSTSSLNQSPAPHSAPASLHSTDSASSLRRTYTAATHLPTRPALSGGAAGLLQRIVTGGDVEVISPPTSTPLPLDTPTAHATPFFTPYRSYVSLNEEYDGQSTHGSRSGDSYDADRDSLESGASDNREVAGETDRTSSRRQPYHTDHRPHRTRPRPPLRQHSSTLRRQLDLGLLHLEQASSSAMADDGSGWVSFDSEGRGRDNDVDDSDAGSVIRRYDAVGHPTLPLPLPVPDVDGRSVSSVTASASEAGSVVVRPEDRGHGGLLPIPVVAAGADADSTDNVEMRMVDERS